MSDDEYMRGVRSIVDGWLSDGDGWKLPTVTRFEVIDGSARMAWGSDMLGPIGPGVEVSISLQDDGRTLKVFVKRREGT